MKDVKFRIFSLSLAAAGIVAGAVLVQAPVASPALAQERCLRTASIGSIKLTDPQTVTVALRNGKTYTSTLRDPCNVHRMEFFTFRSFGGHLCKGDRIRAAKNGRVCILGGFDQVG